MASSYKAAQNEGIPSHELEKTESRIRMAKNDHYFKIIEEIKETYEEQNKKLTEFMQLYFKKKKACRKFKEHIRFLLDELENVKIENQFLLMTNKELEKFIVEDDSDKIGDGGDSFLDGPLLQLE